MVSGYVRRGVAVLTAEVVGPKQRTVLTRLACRQPARLLPMQTSDTERARSASCALAGYGGGFLGGDEFDFEVVVGAEATLSLTTQSSTKVYCKKRDGFVSRQKLQASVGSGGLLVLSPDPVVLYAGAGHVQEQTFRLGRDASIVVVDMVGSGRVARGERWNFKSYHSRSEYFGPDMELAFVDALVLEPTRNPCEVDLGGVQRDVVASIVAAGPRASAVADRLRAAAARLAVSQGSVRQPYDQPEEGFDSLQFSGDVRVGVADVPAGRGCKSNVVARVVAANSEDVTHLVRWCLTPLESSLGTVPYADRIHGTTPAKRASSLGATPVLRRPKSRPVLMSPHDRLWLMQLTDATLPTGGFTHSGGVEAAFQFGLLRVKGNTEGELLTLLSALATSHSRLHVPFAATAHACVSGAPPDGEDLASLGRRLQALLVVNPAACRASELQGRALARLAVPLLGGNQHAVFTSFCQDVVSSKHGAHGHAAIIFGGLFGVLGLEPQVMVEAFVHMTVRDALSAAVRLNLVGPLRAVVLHAEVMETQDFVLSYDLPWAAGTAPLLEASHMCHVMLRSRLFQT